MPSIHSSVSTRRAVRCQSTAGTRNASTPAAARPFDVVGHLRDGGRLEPQVHLELGRAPQVVDDGDRPQPARRRMEPLDQAGGEIVAVEIVLKRRSTPGRRILTATVRRVPSASSTTALCTCAIEAAAIGGPNSTK